MNIITGYRGEAHITAQMDRDINRGIFGSDAYVVKLSGSNLSATIVSANEIRIGSGMICAQGCMAEIPYGTTESLTIENGSQGMQRRDLIVARYKRNTSTGVEDMSLVVKTGTPAASNPSTPAYTSGSIASGATLVEFPLYRVKIDGLTITEVEGLIKSAQNTDETMTAIASIMSTLTGKANTYEWTTDDELVAAIPRIRTREPFLYVGTGRFSQDVLMTDAAHNCFGIGWKPASNTVFLLSVCYARLYYSIQRTDGTGESYSPVKLNTNV